MDKGGWLDAAGGKGGLLPKPDDPTAEIMLLLVQTTTCLKHYLEFELSSRMYSTCSVYAVQCSAYAV
eukprot:9906783-Heterocapsa_arctica.AAC.1